LIENSETEEEKEKVYNCINGFFNKQKYESNLIEFNQENWKKLLEAEQPADIWEVPFVRDTWSEEITSNKSDDSSEEGEVSATAIMKDILAKRREEQDLEEEMAGGIMEFMN
jgi:hypothetical protein